MNELLSDSTIMITDFSAINSSSDINLNGQLPHLEEINNLNKNNYSPLEWAAIANNLEYTVQLIKQGATIFYQEDGWIGKLCSGYIQKRKKPHPASCVKRFCQRTTVYFALRNNYRAQKTIYALLIDLLNKVPQFRKPCKCCFHHRTTEIAILINQIISFFQDLPCICHSKVELCRGYPTSFLNYNRVKSYLSFSLSSLKISLLKYVNFEYDDIVLRPFDGCLHTHYDKILYCHKEYQPTKINKDSQIIINTLLNAIEWYNQNISILEYLLNQQSLEMFEQCVHKMDNQHDLIRGFEHFYINQNIDPNYVNPSTKCSALSYLLEHKDYSKVIQYMLDNGCKLNTSVTFNVDNTDSLLIILPYLSSKTLFSLLDLDYTYYVKKEIMKSLIEKSEPWSNKLLMCYLKICTPDMQDLDLLIKILNLCPEKDYIENDTFVGICIKKNLDKLLMIIVDEEYDYQTPNNDGVTPLELAINYQFMDAIDILLNNDPKLVTTELIVSSLDSSLSVEIIESLILRNSNLTYNLRKVWSLDYGSSDKLKLMTLLLDNLDIDIQEYNQLLVDSVSEKVYWFAKMIFIKLVDMAVITIEGELFKTRDVNIKTELQVNYYKLLYSEIYNNGPTEITILELMIYIIWSITICYIVGKKVVIIRNQPIKSQLETNAKNEIDELFDIVMNKEDNLD